MSKVRKKPKPCPRCGKSSHRKPELQRALEQHASNMKYCAKCRQALYFRKRQKRLLKNKSRRLNQRLAKGHSWRIG